MSKTKSLLNLCICAGLIGSFTAPINTEFIPSNIQFQFGDNYTSKHKNKNKSKKRRK